MCNFFKLFLIKRNGGSIKDLNQQEKKINDKIITKYKINECGVFFPIVKM
jgi:hypothetical protein